MSEWPLILYTLALQFACGLALAATFCDRNSAPAHELMRPIGLAVFPAAVFGLLVSVLHLGRPGYAWKSLFNLGSSRLSFEVFLTLLFVAASAFYAHAWWTQRGEHRLAIGVVTSLLALSAVGSSAAIYLIPTQPAWNSGWVPLSFFGTALLLGGAASVVFLNLEEAPCAPILAGTAIGSLLLIVAAVWMVMVLSEGRADSYAAAQLQDSLHMLTSTHALWFALYLLLAGIIPILLSALLWMRWSNAGSPSALRLLMFLSVTAGTVIGRRLMYLLVTSRSQF